MLKSSQVNFAILKLLSGLRVRMQGSRLKGLIRSLVDRLNLGRNKNHWLGFLDFLGCWQVEQSRWGSVARQISNLSKNLFEIWKQKLYWNFVTITLKFWIKLGSASRYNDWQSYILAGVCFERSCHPQAAFRQNVGGLSFSLSLILSGHDWE